MSCRPNFVVGTHPKCGLCPKAGCRHGRTGWRAALPAAWTAVRVYLRRLAGQNGWIYANDLVRATTKEKIMPAGPHCPLAGLRAALCPAARLHSVPYRHRFVSDAGSRIGDQLLQHRLAATHPYSRGARSVPCPVPQRPARLCHLVSVPTHPALAAGTRDGKGRVSATSKGRRCVTKNLLHISLLDL